MFILKTLTEPRTCKRIVYLRALTARRQRRQKWLIREINVLVLFQDWAPESTHSFRKKKKSHYGELIVHHKCQLWLMRDLCRETKCIMSPLEASPLELASTCLRNENAKRIHLWLISPSYGGRISNFVCFLQEFLSCERTNWNISLLYYFKGAIRKNLGWKRSN